MTHVVEVVPSGSTAIESRPGDFLLVHRPGPVQWAIRSGQTIRYRRKDAALRRECPGIEWVYTTADHAALVVSTDGDLVEALIRGVVRSRLADYSGVPYAYVRVNASPDDQVEIVAYADSVVGERYGWLTIAAEVFEVAPGWPFTFGVPSEIICSGLVAEAEQRMGAIFSGRNPADLTPADLSFYYDVPRRLYALASLA